MREALLSTRPNTFPHIVFMCEHTVQCAPRDYYECVYVCYVCSSMYICAPHNKRWAISCPGYTYAMLRATATTVDQRARHEVARRPLKRPYETKEMKSEFMLLYLGMLRNGNSTLSHTLYVAHTRETPGRASGFSVLRVCVFECVFVCA